MTDARSYIQALRRADAREILEGERKDREAHDGRSVYRGYDYERQEWCECDYCNPSNRHLAKRGGETG